MADTLDEIKAILERIAKQGATAGTAGGGRRALTREEEAAAIAAAQEKVELAKEEYRYYEDMSFVRKGLGADQEKANLLKEAEVELEKAKLALLEQQAKSKQIFSQDERDNFKKRVERDKKEQAAEKRREKADKMRATRRKRALDEGQKFAAQYAGIVTSSFKFALNQSEAGKAVSSGLSGIISMAGQMATLVMSAISFGAALIAAGVAASTLLAIFVALAVALAPLAIGGAILGGLIAFIGWALMAGLEARDLAASFTRLTGASMDYGKEIIELRGELAELGIGAEELTKAYGALYRQTTIFTQSTEAQRKNMGATVAMLEKWGVSAESTAKMMQASVTSLGVSVEVVGDEMAALKSHAELLQVDIAAYMQDFAGMTGELAVYDDAVGTFKNLAAAQKVTGMEMRKIIDLARKFDTFEGAATMAGNLNAALGGNFVNAMDMMVETDPVKRFEMIRDALKDGGVEFENMGYYAKRFYMEQLGLKDVSELAVLMRGDLSDLTGDYGKSADELLKLRKQTQQYQSTLDIFKGFLAKMQPVLAHLVDPIQDWIETLTDDEGGATEAFTKLQNTMTKTVTKGILPVLEALPDATTRTLDAFDKFTTWIDDNHALIDKLATVMEKLLFLVGEFAGEAGMGLGEDIMQVSGWTALYSGELGQAAKDFSAADKFADRGTYMEESWENMKTMMMEGGPTSMGGSAALWDQTTLSMRRLVQAANEKHSLSFNESLEYYDDVFKRLPPEIGKTNEAISRMEGKFSGIPTANLGGPNNLEELMINSSTAGRATPPAAQKAPQNASPIVKQPIKFDVVLDGRAVGDAVIDVIGREIQAVIA